MTDEEEFLAAAKTLARKMYTIRYSEISQDVEQRIDRLSEKLLEDFKKLASRQNKGEETT